MIKWNKRNVCRISLPERNCVSRSFLTHKSSGTQVNLRSIFNYFHYFFYLKTLEKATLLQNVQEETFFLQYELQAVSDWICRRSFDLKTLEVPGNTVPLPTDCENHQLLKGCNFAHYWMVFFFSKCIWNINSSCCLLILLKLIIFSFIITNSVTM